MNNLVFIEIQVMFAPENCSRFNTGSLE